MINENYRNRLQELAGIIVEASDIDRANAFSKSGERVPFNRDLMRQAIEQGLEIGILFQSNNEKYKMPTAKYRIVYPVAMGISPKGNLVIRGFHKLGQSEKAAIETGKRSAEVENTWRLFKVSNIKGMWTTGNFFRGPLEAYNTQGDKGMVNIEVQTNFDAVRKFQDEYIAKMSDDTQRLQKKKNIIHLFKQSGERPVEKPIDNPSTDVQNKKADI